MGWRLFPHGLSQQCQTEFCVLQNVLESHYIQFGAWHGQPIATYLLSSVIEHDQHTRIENANQRSVARAKDEA